MVFSWLKSQSAEETRVHIDDPGAVLTLSRRLSVVLEESPKRKNPLIVCIGTDRSTGDSLGPLTGWRLDKLLFKKAVSVFGTVDNPVHAQNLQALLGEIAESSQERPVIAVDACLGVLSNVKTILLEEKPLRPGTGVNKTLPPVGDVSISGIVNTGGFMEIQVLQNTRLAVVMKMAHVIADSIYLALQKTGRF